MSQDLVGQRIKTIRRQRGLSQAQLAHPELSDSYVSLIESGKRTPTPAVLELLAVKLDCSLTYLVNGVTATQMHELELELGYALMALENGAVAEARRRYADLVADNAVAGLAQLRQDAEYGLALAMEACGDLDAAIATFNGLRATAAGNMSPERHIAVAVALSRCYRDRGDLSAAVQVGEQILTGTVRPAWTDELVELGSTLLGVYLVRGDLLRARQYSAELLAAAERLGPRATVAACWNASLVAEASGHGEEALALMERAFAIHSEVGERRNLYRLRFTYHGQRFRVRPEEAETSREGILRAQRELSESSAGIADRVRCEMELAHVEFGLDRPAEAAGRAEAARKLVSTSTRDLGADVHLVLGGAYAMLGKIKDARESIATATQWLERVVPPRHAAQGWCTVADVLGRLKDREGSIAAYQKALACAGL
ncbi:helix-turn-helix domain-containing protein [Streptosporangium soli]|nr:helix-turn-helix domain-containing protein [Streptosporangium sp. KLBMP 9127]